MDMSKWVDLNLGACLGKMGFVAGFLCRKTSKLAGDMIVSVFGYLVPLLVILVRHFFRMDEDKSCCSPAPLLAPISSVDSIDSVKSGDYDTAEFFRDDSSEEEESPKLKFKFQSFEEFCQNKGEEHSKDFQPVSFCKLVEQLEDVELHVRKNYESEKVETLESGEGSGDGFSSSKDFFQPGCVEECFPIGQSEEEILETKVESVEFGIEEDKNEAELSAKSESSESMVSEDERVDTSCMNESITDGFISDAEFIQYLEQDIDVDQSSLESLENDEVEALKEIKKLIKSQSKDWSVDIETDDFDDEYDDLFKDPDSTNVEDFLGSDFLSDNDFGSNQEMHDSETTSNWEDDEESETLWEHDDILEQLSIEIKNARATGLPTIDEHTEISKFSDNLKPWKFEEKFQPGDTFSIVHKFYRTYWEKMRKLDILSYQKMYAIGLLQAKEALESVSGDSKSDTQVSALFHNLWRNKNKKIGAEPVMKFIRELRNDLELVYVGQLCLSWDILHWQYEKAVELWEADPHGLRRFNLVCSEFQQFEVLLQRFVEDERYQGPRVHSYVNSRRGLHNLLLQVPVIREDKRGKKKGSPLSDEPLSSDMLVEGMEESIRTFWKFLRADTHELTSKKAIQCELQDPADAELLFELTKTLQKKEKKLKDILRTRTCILKKFKRRHEDDQKDQVLCFFSQVDIRLVARVLRMSRLTTNQLHWCRNKLSSINFANGRIHVEPSFSLFPC